MPEKDTTIIIQRALGREHIDEVLQLSEKYRKETSMSPYSPQPTPKTKKNESLLTTSRNRPRRQNRRRNTHRNNLHPTTRPGPRASPRPPTRLLPPSPNPTKHLRLSPRPTTRLRPSPRRGTTHLLPPSSPPPPPPTNSPRPHSPGARTNRLLPSPRNHTSRPAALARLALHRTRHHQDGNLRRALRLGQAQALSQPQHGSHAAARGVHRA
jgi:hypothetical protein